MKTAISVPDVIYRKAEKLARRLRKSRSQLYSEAMAAYLRRHDEDDVTEAVNRALGNINKRIDRLMRAAAQRTLDQSEW